MGKTDKQFKPFVLKNLSNFDKILTESDGNGVVPLTTLLSLSLASSVEEQEDLQRISCRQSSVL